MASNDYTPSLKVADFYSKLFLDILKYGGYIFKIFVFIFFIRHFIKKTPNICNIYFYLLIVGFFWDIATQTSGATLRICGIFATGDSNDECLWPAQISNTLQWYNAQFSALWTLVLTINRLTAIVWWHCHDKFWSKHFYKFPILLLLYPFLLNGYSFVNYRCRFMLENCPNYWKEDANVTGLASGIIALISLIIAVVTAVIYRMQISAKVIPVNQKTEHKLVIQAVISSLTYVCYSILHVFWQMLKDYGKTLEFLTVEFGMNLSHTLYHLSGFVLIFVLSPILRHQLANFYHLTWLCKCNKKKFKTRIAQIHTTTKSDTLCK